MTFSRAGVFNWAVSEPPHGKSAVRRRYVVRSHIEIFKTSIIHNRGDIYDGNFRSMPLSNWDIRGCH